MTNFVILMIKINSVISQKRGSHYMNFAEKLIKLRKKTGLSQEELAVKINVSRQVVNKWENLELVPELENILKLSKLFNVSTDYLIKDDLGLSDSSFKKEVMDYLESSKKSSFKLAFGTFLCILSPVLLIVLTILSDTKIGLISMPLAVIIGIGVLFFFIIISVILFLLSMFSNDKYKHILRNDLKIEMNLSNIVKGQREDFRVIYNSCILIGVILCILSPISLVISAIIGNIYAITISLVLLFLLVSIAVFMFVFASVRWQSFENILHDGGYKMRNNLTYTKISNVIWILATILYLSISFIFGYWNLTWIIWVIAALIQTILFIMKKEE